MPSQSKRQILPDNTLEEIATGDIDAEQAWSAAEQRLKDIERTLKARP